MDLERPGPLGSYAREVKLALPAGEGMILRRARAEVADLSMSPEELALLAELDADVIDAILQAGADELAPDLLDDDASAPLTDWWWHLGAIRAGTYPLDLLPEPLRAAAKAA